MRYMQGLFHDWHAKNITSVLHESAGVRQQHGVDARPRGEGRGAGR
jgi:hypothetical protein